MDTENFRFVGGISNINISKLLFFVNFKHEHQQTIVFQ